MVDESAFRTLRLAVRASKSEDEGMNLVFMAYSDFCTLAGSNGQHDSVRIILEVSLALIGLLVAFYAVFLLSLPFLYACFCRFHTTHVVA